MPHGWWANRPLLVVRRRASREILRQLVGPRLLVVERRSLRELILMPWPILELLRSGEVIELLGRRTSLERSRTLHALLTYRWTLIHHAPATPTTSSSPTTSTTSATTLVVGHEVVYLCLLLWTEFCKRGGVRLWTDWPLADEAVILTHWPLGDLNEILDNWFSS